MNNFDFFLALEELEKSSKLDKELIISSIEAGIAAALKKETGESRAIAIKMNPEKGEIRYFAYKTVVEDEAEIDKYEISLEEALKIKNDAKVGDIIGEDVPAGDVSRIAAQTATQVVLQRLNDARKELAHEEMSKREGELVQAIVRRVESTAAFVEIVGTQTEAIMPKRDQVYGEKLSVGDKIKVYVKKVKINNRGQQQVIVSRSDAGFVRKLFEIEVPEIRSNLVKIKNIVRDAGTRTKIAVYSDDPNVDSTGACIGQKGVRVNAIVSELNGEKVDVILYSNDPTEYITRALGHVKVIMVKLNQVENTAKVVVPDDKLSLAIGKRGQNAKLAMKLTGYKIDVKAYSDIVANLEEKIELDKELNVHNKYN